MESQLTASSPQSSPALPSSEELKAELLDIPEPPEMPPAVTPPGYDEALAGAATTIIQACAVEQHCVGRQGHVEPVFERGNAQGAAFEFGLFEKRTVEVRHPAEFFSDRFPAFWFRHRQYVEEEFVDFVEVLHLFRAEQPA